MRRESGRNDDAVGGAAVEALPPFVRVPRIPARPLVCGNQWKQVMYRQINC